MAIGVLCFVVKRGWEQRSYYIVLMCNNCKGASTYITPFWFASLVTPSKVQTGHGETTWEKKRKQSFGETRVVSPGTATAFLASSLHNPPLAAEVRRQIMPGACPHVPVDLQREFSSSTPANKQVILPCG